MAPEVSPTWKRESLRPAFIVADYRGN